MNSLEVFFSSVLIGNMDSHHCNFCFYKLKGNIPKTKYRIKKFLNFFSEEKKVLLKKYIIWVYSESIQVDEQSCLTLKLSGTWNIQFHVNKQKPQKYLSQCWIVSTVKTDCFTQVAVQTKFYLKLFFCPLNIFKWMV